MWIFNIILLISMWADGRVDVCVNTRPAVNIVWVGVGGIYDSIYNLV